MSCDPVAVADPRNGVVGDIYVKGPDGSPLAAERVICEGCEGCEGSSWEEWLSNLIVTTFNRREAPEMRRLQLTLDAGFASLMSYCTFAVPQDYTPCRRSFQLKTTLLTGRRLGGIRDLFERPVRADEPLGVPGRMPSPGRSDSRRSE